MSDRHPGPGSVGTAPRPAVPSVPPPIPPLPWEHLFPALAPDVQHALLTRAAARGGLTPDDVPAPPPAADRVAACLADPDGLPPFEPAELADAGRPPAEYWALAAALGCPDLFLIDAAAGPGQFDLAAGLAGEAARRGERVLLVTPAPADADAVVARLAETCLLPVGRAVAPFEHAERLPAASAARTAPAHGEAALTDAREKVAVAASEAQERLAAVRAAVGALPGLRSAAEELARSHVAEEELIREQASASEPGAAEDHAAALAQLDADIAKVAADRETRRAEVAAVRAQLAESAEPAAKSGGLFAKLKGLLHRDEPSKAGELGARLRAAEDALQAADAEAVRLAAERTAAEARQRDREDCQAADAQRIREVRRDRERVEADASRACEVLAGVGADVPDLGDPAAVDRAAAQLAGLAEKAEAEVAFAREWATALADRGPELVRRFLGLVRVTVGPFAAVGKDPLTRPAAGDPAPAFDRLIVTAADRMAEVEFVPVARLAARWVLIGDASDERARGHRPVMFRRLLSRVRREPWDVEGVCLVARLAAVDGELVSEPLADQPDVELRFGRGADGEPVVAEVVFPPTTPLAEGKAFLARELGEVRLAPCGLPRWHESDESVTATWPAADHASHGADWADLSGGVREQVAGTGPDGLTTAVTFDKAAGWDRASAVAWVARHAPAPRAASVPRPVLIADTPRPRRPVGAIG